VVRKWRTITNLISLVQTPNGAPRCSFFSVFIIVLSRSNFKKKPYVPYVPKLLPAQVSPDAITWSNSPSNRDRIIALFTENKSHAEIASLTCCSLAMVRKVIYRHLHPDEFEIPTPSPTHHKNWIVLVCKNCDKSFEVMPSVARAGKKSCSMPCLWAGRDKRRS
jgi:hypothetical protein